MASPDEPEEGEEVFSPATDRTGVQRVPEERPVVTPKPDLSGRDPDGPKTKHFELDDIDDAAAKIDGAVGGPRAERKPGTKDKTLSKFLET